MRKKSISDLDPEQLRQLLAIGKEDQEQSDDSSEAKIQTAQSINEEAMVIDRIPFMRFGRLDDGSRLGPIQGKVICKILLNHQIGNNSENRMEGIEWIAYQSCIGLVKVHLHRLGPSAIDIVRLKRH